MVTLTLNLVCYVKRLGIVRPPQPFCASTIVAPFASCIFSWCGTPPHAKRPFTCYVRHAHLRSGIVLIADDRLNSIYVDG